MSSDTGTSGSDAFPSPMQECPSSVDDVKNEVLEQSALEYARSSGVAIDHLAHPLPLNHIRQLQTTLFMDDDDETLLPFELPAEPERSERLASDQEIARILAHAQHRPDQFDHSTPLLDVRRSLKLKLEMPLLRSDHEVDCQHLLQRQIAALDGQGIPTDVLDDENDEALTWPSKYRNLMDRTLEDVKRDRIQMQPKDMVFLQQALYYDGSAPSLAPLWASIPSYKRNGALDHITPPLSPAYFDRDQFIPSSPTAQLPFTSDPASPLIDDIKASERAVYRNDRIDCLGNSEEITLSQLDELFEPSIKRELPDDDLPSQPFLPQKRFKIEDLKVDVPLMPRTSSPPSRKTVSFDEDVEMLRYADKETAEEILHDDNKLCEELFDTETMRSLGCRIEQERLQAADSIHRVNIPILEFTYLPPPWAFLQRMRRSDELLKHQVSWAGKIFDDECLSLLTSKMSINKLDHGVRWTLIPVTTADPFIAEQLDGAESSTSFLDDSSRATILTSTHCTWTRDRLLVLEHDDDDEELQPGVFRANVAGDAMISNGGQASTMLQAGVKKTNEIGMPQLLAMHDLHCNPVKESAGFKTDAIQMRSEGASSVVKHGATGFSVNSAINDFLELRGISKPGCETSDHFACAAHPDSLIALEKAQKSNEEGLTRDQDAEMLATCLPVVPLTTNAAVVIISVQIAIDRVLLRSLQSCIPILTIIERDFATHNTVIWRPGTITRSPHRSTLSTEADVIISPSTGIIFTTLQKIKQKALPGQKATLSDICSRIIDVGKRYENLIVLISSGQSSDQPLSFSDDDSLALSNFIGFCQSISDQTTITTNYVAGGQVETGKFLASMIINATSNLQESEGLMQDETQWELFLRRAGMNAYAAQVVLARLKAPEGVDAGSPSKAGVFGLTGFLEMSKVIRLSRFVNLLGGERVLTRVSDVLDSSCRAR